MFAPLVLHSTRIDSLVICTSLEEMKKNREILTPIVNCLEFCGRQGIGLRGHRDDGSCESSNMGDYKALIKMRVYSGNKCWNTI